MDQFDFVIQLRMVTDEFIAQVTRVNEELVKNLGGNIEAQIDIKAKVDKSAQREVEKLRNQVVLMQEAMDDTAKTAVRMQEAINTIAKVGGFKGSTKSMEQFNDFLAEGVKTTEQLLVKIDEISNIDVGSEGLNQLINSLETFIKRRELVFKRQKAGKIQGLEQAESEARRANDAIGGVRDTAVDLFKVLSLKVSDKGVITGNEEALRKFLAQLDKAKQNLADFGKATVPIDTFTPDKAQKLREAAQTLSELSALQTRFQAKQRKNAATNAQRIGQTLITSIGELEVFLDVIVNIDGPNGIISQLRTGLKDVEIPLNLDKSFVNALKQGALRLTKGLALGDESNLKPGQNASIDRRIREGNERRELVKRINNATSPGRFAQLLTKPLGTLARDMGKSVATVLRKARQQPDPTKRLESLTDKGVTEDLALLQKAIQQQFRVKTGKELKDVEAVNKALDVSIFKAFTLAISQAEDAVLSLAESTRNQKRAGEFRSDKIEIDTNVAKNVEREKVVQTAADRLAADNKQRVEGALQASKIETELNRQKNSERIKAVREIAAVLAAGNTQRVAGAIRAQQIEDALNRQMNAARIKAVKIIEAGINADERQRVQGTIRAQGIEDTLNVTQNKKREQIVADQVANKTRLDAAALRKQSQLGNLLNSEKNKEISIARKRQATMELFNRLFEEQVVRFGSRLSVFTAQRPQFQQGLQEGTTFDRLSKDLGALNTATNKFGLLRAQQALSGPDEVGAVNRQLTTSLREIIVQEGRIAQTALGDSQEIFTVPKLVRALQTFTDSEGNTRARIAFERVKGTEGLRGPEAFTQLSRLFENSLAEPLQRFNKNVETRRQRAFARKDLATAEGLTGIDQNEFLKTLFEGGPRLKEVEQAMKGALVPMDRFKKDFQAAFTVSQKLVDNIRKQTIATEILNKVDQRRLQRATKLAGIARAIRGLSFTIGGFAVGITIGQKIREALGSVVELERELAGIQGVLPTRSLVDTQFLKAGIVGASQKFGVDLIETAKAARILAQTGIEATEVIEELNITLLASRGLGITTEQMQNLQIAVRAVAGELQALGATSAVLDKIARVESNFAITAIDLADAIKVASPVVNQFSNTISGLNDVFDLTIGLSTVMVEQLRITGSQAGNAIKFILARLARPEVLTKLQDQFNIRIAADQGGENLLPLQDILTQLAGTYESLGQAQKQQFAVLLAGGRRVNAIIPVLKNFDKVLEASNESARAFGDVNARAELSLNTLGGSVDRLGVNFKIFTDALVGSTGLTGGLRLVIDLFNELLSVSSQGPGGALFGLAASSALIGGTGVAGRALFRGRGNQIDAAALRNLGALAPGGGVLTGRVLGGLLRQRQTAETANVLGLGSVGLIGRIQAESAGKATGRGLGTAAASASLLNPTVVVIGSIIGLLLAAGIITLIINKVRQNDRFRAEAKSLGELGFFESGQFRDLTRQTRALDKEGNLRGTINFENPQQALEEFNKLAIRPGIETRIVLDKAFGKGASFEDAANQLEALSRAAKLDKFQTLRIDLVEALVKDLPEGLVNLDAFENRLEGIAAVTQIIAGAALAANASFDNLQVQFEENTQRLATEGRANLEIVLGDPDAGLGARIAENIKRGLVGLNAFTANLADAASLADKVRQGTLNPTGDRRLVAPTVTTADILRRNITSIVGPAEITAGLFTAGAAGFELNKALEKITKDVIVSTDSVGIALIKFFDSIKETTNSIGVTFKELDEQGKVSFVTVTNQEEIFVRALAARFEAAVLNDPVSFGVAGLLSPNTLDEVGLAARQGRLTAEAVQRTIVQLARRAEASGLGEQAIQAQTEVLEQSLGGFEVSIAGTSGKLRAFRDELVSFLLRVRKAFQDIEVNALIATVGGTAFDRTAATRDASRDIFSQSLVLQRDLEDRIISERAKFETLLGDKAITQIFTGNREGLQALANAEGGEELKVVGEDAVRARLEGLLDSLQAGFIKGARFSDILTLKKDGETPVDPEIIRVVEKLRDDLGIIVGDKELRNTANLLLAVLKASEDQFHISSLLLRARENESGLIKRQLDIRQQILGVEKGVASRIQDPVARFQAEASILATSQAQVFDELLAQQANVLKGDIVDEAGDKEARRELRASQALISKEAFDTFNRNNVDAFTNQFRTNVNSALAGVQAAFTNLDLFAGIGAGETSIKTLINTLLGPIGQTLQTRIVTNLTEDLAEALSDDKLVQELFGSVETRLLDAMVDGSVIAGSNLFNAMVLGGRFAAGEITQAQARTELARGESGLNGIIAGRSIKDSLLIAGGPIIGSLVGGIAANASNNDTSLVSTGSGIGTAAGLLAGARIGAIGGPLGAAIGGVLGGLAGGFLGGSKEDKKEKRQIAVLQAIERAQIETIATIEGQTDALLNPQNRLLNVPAGFTVPAFNPGQAGGIQSLSFDFSGMVVNGDVGLAEVRQSISDAVVEGINTSRRTTSRSIRRF